MALVGSLVSRSRLLDRYTAAITGDGATACPPDTLLKPCVIPQLSKLQVITVAAGNDHSGAVTSMGRLYMWGSNEFGQVTDPSMTWYSFIVEYSTLLHFFWICPVRRETQNKQEAPGSFLGGTATSERLGASKGMPDHPDPILAR